MAPPEPLKRSAAAELASRDIPSRSAAIGSRELTACLFGNGTESRGAWSQTRTHPISARHACDEGQQVPDRRGPSARECRCEVMGSHLQRGKRRVSIAETGIVAMRACDRLSPSWRRPCGRLTTSRAEKWCARRRTPSPRANMSSRCRRPPHSLQGGSTCVRSPARPAQHEGRSSPADFRPLAPAAPRRRHPCQPSPHGPRR